MGRPGNSQSWTSGRILVNHLSMCIYIAELVLELIDDAGIELIMIFRLLTLKLDNHLKESNSQIG